MQIHIQSLGFDLTSAISDHAVHRLRFALAHAADHIRRVTVRLSDINGPRGGSDKRCRILVTMEKLPEVAVEDIESDLYVAIDRATDRAARTVTRRIARTRIHRKGGAMPQADSAPLAVD